MFRWWGNISVTLKEYIDSRFLGLKEYADTRFQAYERAVDAALASAEKAVLTALNAQEERNKTFNEFRTLSNDRDANFASNEKVAAIDARLNKVENNQTGSTGKYQGVVLALVGLASIASLLISVAMLVLRIRANG